MVIVNRLLSCSRMLKQSASVFKRATGTSSATGETRKP
jgi:hypothetical protein